MAQAAMTSPTDGWLLGVKFDVMFIIGLVALGTISAAIVATNNDLFGVVLFLDLWLLGYHHVVSTFTRLAMDPEARADHKFLLYGMPVIVLAVCIALVYGLGLWTMGTIYLYWQWWHYTRQSWGVSQAYRGRAKGGVKEDPRLLMAVHYAVPIWGILARSNEAQETFLGLPLKTLPIPTAVVWVAGLIALGTVFVWMASRMGQLLRGELPLAHTLYVSSHLAIFVLAYKLIPDITLGWLAVNIWHNAQYILFVWMFNTKRFSKPDAPKDILIARLSKPNNFVLYFGFCLGLSTVTYYSLSMGVDAFKAYGVPGMVLLYSAINFHHYMVDTYIWKLRKPSLKKALELDPV